MNCTATKQRFFNNENFIHVFVNIAGFALCILKNYYIASYIRPHIAKQQDRTVCSATKVGVILMHLSISTAE